MRVSLLVELLSILRITSTSYAKAIGVSPIKLKKEINRGGDHVIRDEVLLNAIVEHTPDIILVRIQKMRSRLERLQQFGPALYELKKGLQSTEKMKAKETRWAERFARVIRETGGSLVMDSEPSSIDREVRKELEHGVDKRTQHDPT